MPTLTVIAGPNGSGKSTLTQALVEAGVQFGEYLNADDIARSLSGSPEWVTRQAQQIVRERRSHALAQGIDHAFETVMSHPSHITYMTDAGRRGFSVRLFFVATESPLISVDRVANRVLHGGHDVPGDRVIARYHRCLANLPAAIDAASRCDVFDNSSSDRPLALLATIVNDRPGASLLSHEPRLPRVDGEVNGEVLPVWWLDVLLRIKPADPFIDGPLS